MEISITAVPPAYRRRPLPEDVARDLSLLRIAVFAPPLVEPFQPSLTLPYLAAQMRTLGYAPWCHNLSSRFYNWLFRCVRLESVPLYKTLRRAISALKSPERFYEPLAYEDALCVLFQRIWHRTGAGLSNSLLAGQWQRGLPEF